MATENNNSQSSRNYQRRTSYIIAEYTVKEGVFRDIIKNIGAKGLFISTKRAIAQDQEIFVRFPLFQFEHEIEARGGGKWFEAHPMDSPWFSTHLLRDSSPALVNSPTLSMKLIAFK